MAYRWKAAIKVEEPSFSLCTGAIAGISDGTEEKPHINLSVGGVWITSVCDACLPSFFLRLLPTCPTAEGGLHVQREVAAGGEVGGQDGPVWGLPPLLVIASCLCVCRLL